MEIYTSNHFNLDKELHNLVLENKINTLIQQKISEICLIDNKISGDCFKKLLNEIKIKLI